MNETPDINTGPLSVNKRFFRWLSSRRIMRRLLLVVSGLITVGAIIYARVNWYGQRLWEKLQT